MNDQAHFRLFELPYDLIEYVSLFFDTGEARKLLTVSGAFHDLFARRVWRKLDSRVFTLSQPARSAAIARYSKLVRDIDLDYGICSAIESELDKGVSVYAILSVFSGANTLRISLGYDLFISIGMQYKDIMMCFPSLYKLAVVIDQDSKPYDIDTLALAINQRHNNRSMKPIRCLSLRYSLSAADNPWTRLSHFVQLVLSNCVMKIEITPWSTTRILPSQSEVQILSKYLVKTPDITEQGDAQLCYATINRSLYWRPLDQSNLCAYSQLRQLSIRTCCASSDTYDYCDFVPSNFPSHQSIYISGRECDKMMSSSYSYSPAWQKVLLQTWPHLDELTLSIDMTCEQLVTILEYNRRLTRLNIHLQPKMLDENRILNLAIILPLFPQLQRLHVIGENEMKLDYNPDYNDSDIFTRSQLNLTLFTDLYLSSRVFECLYSLPKLNTVYINRCSFHSTGADQITDMDIINDDPNEIDMIDDEDNDGYDNDDSTYAEMLNTLNTISARYSSSNPCGIKVFYLDISRDDYDWPLDFTLEMIALIPKLRNFHFSGETGEIPKAVKERFPYTSVTHYSP